MINRKKIPLENIKICLSMAVMLKDELSSDKKAIGDVFLKASGIKKAIVRHSTGYFLLIDLSEGKHNLTAGGEFYRQVDFSVDTKSIDPKKPFVDFVDISLKPNSHYPFPEGKPVLKGMIVDAGNEPIPEASIQIKGMKENAVSEDDGGFFIQFGDIDRDKKMILTIKKDGYKDEDMKVVLKKGTVTHIEVIKLNRE